MTHSQEHRVNTSPGAGQALADRFFARQRREILARVEARAAARRARRYGAVLAAAAAMLVCLMAGVAVSDPPGAAWRESSAVLAFDIKVVPASGAADYPLEAFGAWTFDGDNGSNSGNTVITGLDGLPPIELEQGATTSDAEEPGGPDDILPWMS